MRPRVELVEVADGVRSIIVAEPLKTRAPRPVSRKRTAAGSGDEEAAAALLRSPDGQASWLLEEGRGQRRRWQTVIRHARGSTSPLMAEQEALPELIRCGAMIAWDRPDGAGGWRVAHIATTALGAQAAGYVDAEELAGALAGELSSNAARKALVAGPPPAMRWPAFAFVLRAVDRYTEQVAHGAAPRPRELAGAVAHTKAWTPARQELFARIVGDSWPTLFPPRPRQLRVRGPLLNPQASVWTEGVSPTPLSASDQLRAILCVENYETFDELLDISEEGWLILQVPGGPPPAEVELLERVHALAPAVPVFAAFDPDPAGLRIARLLTDGSGVPLEGRLMGAAALAACAPLPLTEWDRAELRRQAGRLDGFDELHRAITHTGQKGEQETAHSWLRQQINGFVFPRQ